MAAKALHDLALWVHWPRIYSKYFSLSHYRNHLSIPSECRVSLIGAPLHYLFSPGLCREVCLLSWFPLNINSLQRSSMTTPYKEKSPRHSLIGHALLIICVFLDYLICACFTQLVCNVNCYAHCYTLCVQICVWLTLGTQQICVENYLWFEYAQATYYQQASTNVT